MLFLCSPFWRPCLWTLIWHVSVRCWPRTRSRSGLPPHPTHTIRNTTTPLELVNLFKFHNTWNIFSAEGFRLISEECVTIHGVHYPWWFLSLIFLKQIMCLESMLFAHRKTNALSLKVKESIPRENGSVGFNGRSWWCKRLLMQYISSSYSGFRCRDRSRAPGRMFELRGGLAAWMMSWLERPAMDRDVLGSSSGRVITKTLEIERAASLLGNYQGNIWTTSQCYIYFSDYFIMNLL